MAEDPGGEAPGLWTSARVLSRMARMSVALRVVGFKRLYLTLHRRDTEKVTREEAMSAEAGPDHSDGGSISDPLDEARRAAGIVMFVNRRYSPLEAGCLVESLTIWSLLRRCGIAADLRLGVRTFIGPLQSHAWVEYQGVPLNDSENVGRVFEPFDLSEISSDAELS